MAAEAKVDLNSVAYDAPLSFPEPPPAWVAKQTRRGAVSTWLTEASVPGTDLTGKWVVISGGNNGIGREAALQFASWGANLILACREPPPKEMHPAAVVDQCKARHKAAGKLYAEVEWWHIDMTNLATVEAFAKRWLDTGRPLDILCNNAGMGCNPGGAKIMKTADGFEMVHQASLTRTSGLRVC